MVEQAPGCLHPQGWHPAGDPATTAQLCSDRCGQHDSPVEMAGANNTTDTRDIHVFLRVLVEGGLTGTILDARAD